MSLLSGQPLNSVRPTSIPETEFSNGMATADGTDTDGNIA